MAARLVDASEQQLEYLLNSKQVLIRLEEKAAGIRDPQTTFLLAVNQCLRFCPNVSVYVPHGASELLSECNSLSKGIHASHARLIAVAGNDFLRFDAVLNVGTAVPKCLPWITVNSGGWVARLATAGAGIDNLFWENQTHNALGAIAAACLGTSAVFLQLVGKQVPRAFEISLFSHESAAPGLLPLGPALPTTPLPLSGFVVGCGAVTNGWAYAVKRLPIIGELQAVDSQAVQLWNLGTYVGADREWLQKPKVDAIRALLSPEISVIPRPEEWELFKIRLERGPHRITLPALVVNGLDNVDTRHSVQRLWPATLIDMAAGGLTSQVIVSQPRNGGLCLLRALIRPERELTWAERLSRDTGLRVERILNEPTTPITQDDVHSSPYEKRIELQNALGQLICGHVTRHNLEMEGAQADFAPAVPFVTTWSGVTGAAETLKCLMGYRQVSSLHYQKSFQSGRIRALEMVCDPHCECRTARR